MSTYLISMNPSDTLEQITITNPGPATTAKMIELNIDLGALINDGAAPVSPRTIKRGEIHTAMTTLLQQIINDPNLEH